MRLWKTPVLWTRNDYIVHFEDMISRNGVPPNLRAWLHREIGRKYAIINRTAALQHYGEAIAICRNPNLVVEMGDLLTCYRRYGEAQKCYREIAQSVPHDPAIQQRLTYVNRLLAKQELP